MSNSLKVMSNLSSKPKSQSKYLNYNSTFVGGFNSTFNPSDVNYNQVQDNVNLENEVKDYIKSLVNAPDNSDVIFNSGSTESIATVINWSKSISPNGLVLGSVLDHPSVEMNCKNMDVEYRKLSYSMMKNQKGIDIPINTGLVFITGVSPSTGEIYNQHFKQYNYIYNNNSNVESILMNYTTDYNDIESNISIPENLTESSNIIDRLTGGNIVSNQKYTHYMRPLKVLDATQMIGKLDIDIIDNDLDAIFFSLHKIGGEYNCGILVVNQSHYQFKPLIAGNQQNQLRGGTYNSYAYDDIDELLRNYSKKVKLDSCKEVYQTFTAKLDENGIEYRKPELNHLYNTILINLDHCNANVIYQLSLQNIFVGSETACQYDNEAHNLRISYLNGHNFDTKTMDKIIKVIKDDA